MSRFFYKLGSYLLYVLAAAHFIFNHNGFPIPITDKESALLVKLMDSYEITHFGISRTVNQVLDGFILTWGLMVIFIAYLNLKLIRNICANSDLYRAATWGNTFLFGSSFIASVIFWSLPQMFFLFIITACFLLAARHRD